ncbi:hypothetical protein L9F63_019381, partial [Diploptera punctata]
LKLESTTVKLANDVEYCLCSGDLCNGNPNKRIPSDDEDQDISEGSGAESRDNVNKPRQRQDLRLMARRLYIRRRALEL